MNNFIELSEDAFATLFKPVANHLNPDASFDWGDGYGTLFETFGDELAYVQSQPPENIWTLLCGDGDCVVSGFHFVNRLGYFVTNFAVPKGVEIQVSIPQSMDLSDSPPLPQRVAECLNFLIEYLWKDEKNDYHATSIPDRKWHIFRSLCLIRKWLNHR